MQPEELTTMTYLESLDASEEQIEQEQNVDAAQAAQEKQK